MASSQLKARVFAISNVLRAISSLIGHLALLGNVRSVWSCFNFDPTDEAHLYSSPVLWCRKPALNATVFESGFDVNFSFVYDDIHLEWSRNPDGGLLKGKARSTYFLSLFPSRKRCELKFPRTYLFATCTSISITCVIKSRIYLLEVIIKNVCDFL